jgi:pimeloyl-ACP methyl ester carboxylesterase
VLPAFEERFTVLAIDRRGRGRSGDGGVYALEREYEDVVAVVEWAGGEVNLLGHSYGGVCAVEAALRTDRIGKLVLYEPPLGFVATPPSVVRRLEELLEDGRREELLTVFLEDVVSVPPDEIEFLRSLPGWRARLAAAHTIPREERANREYTFDPSRFGDLRVPTLYLQGSDSGEPFKTAGAALLAALPDCRAVVMPGQRHAAMDTGAELFTTSVLTFLKTA